LNADFSLRWLEAELKFFTQQQINIKNCAKKTISLTLKADPKENQNKYINASIHLSYKLIFVHRSFPTHHGNKLRYYCHCRRR
jgi:hypothetical protein